MGIPKLLIPITVCCLFTFMSCTNNELKENQEKMVGEWQSVQSRITLTVFRVDEIYFVEFCKRHLNKEKRETYRIKQKTHNLFIDDRYSTPIIYDREKDRIISFPYGEYFRKNH